MRKSFASLMSVVTLAFIVIVVGKYVIVAQAPITGEWRADTRAEHQERKDKDSNDWGATKERYAGPRLQLNLERTTANGHNSNGNSYAYNELQGLTEAQTQNGRVNFSLVREAGTINFEGTFTNGRGVGTFTFVPNRQFIDTMKSKGFDFESAKKRESVDDRLLSAALVNVTTALADDLNSANFGKLEADDLFKAAIFKVDGKFMAEMKATGFPNMQMEDLVKARIFNINADYVRQVHEMGFDNREFEGLVKFRIFNVTPEFLNGLKAAGLEKLDSEEVVKARIFNISPDFVREAKAQDPSVTMEDLVRMKIGVGKPRKPGDKDKDKFEKTWN
jgi:hypothetical protein